MRRRYIILLAALGAALTFALGPLGPIAPATTQSPVICDEHPNEPWLCSDGGDTYTNYDYVMYADFGWTNYTDPSVFDANNVEGDTVTSDHVDADHTPDIWWPVEACPTSRGTKSEITYLTGSGSIVCPDPVNIYMTLCLEKSSQPYPASSWTWVHMACKTESNLPRPGHTVNPRALVFKVHKACSPTGYRYRWKVQQFINVYRPGFIQVGTKVHSSYYKLYMCQ